MHQFRIVKSEVWNYRNDKIWCNATPVKNKTDQV